MPTTAELQREIRSIRRELSRLDTRLAQLEEDLRKHKDAPPASSDASLCNAVYNLAAHLPVLDHPLIGESPAVKKQYLALLFMAASVGGPVSADQLLLLQRIIFADKEDNHLDNYLAAANTLNPRDIFDKPETAIKE